ncbi:hypothetical protein OIC43_30995 [Streptomyces sp. NBC_00825]|uniref:hypothetical protein n=1 Tax=unclassified Streptomyces TaxID=2593676 RepID=UPI002ED55101|nr:hypothetical protein OG832_12690 [Streptomyces sp. NBC_00826]WTH93142.1 hypothetical protein OIC43_30995 [Streptomyces sp. NBC_00825]WTI01874.1 hypothetical protein OHA23_30975 [Streptomyces sp. NBC_00822]
MPKYTFIGNALEADDPCYISTPIRRSVHGTVTANSPYEARVKAEAAIRAKGCEPGDIDVTLA